MLPPLSSSGDRSDSFRLHYVLGTRRCVVSYDTLEAALKGAFKRLEKDRSIELWISDEAKPRVLDADQIRARFLQTEQGRSSGPD